MSVALRKELRPEHNTGSINIWPLKEPRCCSNLVAVPVRFLAQPRITNEGFGKPEAYRDVRRQSR